MEKKALNRPVSNLARTAEKEIIDIVSNRVNSDGMAAESALETHAERVKEALGTMYMDISCSNCGSSKVIRAGACGVCTECGTSQGCS